MDYTQIYSLQAFWSIYNVILEWDAIETKTVVNGMTTVIRYYNGKVATFNRESKMLDTIKWIARHNTPALMFNTDTTK